MYFIVPKGSFHRKRSPSLSEGGYGRESIIIRNYYLVVWKVSGALSRERNTFIDNFRKIIMKRTKK